MTSTPRKINHMNRFRQPIDFTNLTWGVLGATDFDIVIDFKNKVWVLCEFKVKGTKVPLGQRLALERFVDNMALSGRHAIAIIIEHDTPPDEVIRAEDGVVKSVYYAENSKRTWVDETNGRDLMSVINSYVIFTEGKTFLENIKNNTYRG